MKQPSLFEISRRTALATLAGGVLFCGTSAFAQNTYPSRPIKLVVGYAPGGSVDMAARVVADILSARLKNPVVVENVAGAAGVVGAQKVVSSPADGYTLLVGSSNEMAATVSVNPAQRYDPSKDFTPISLLATVPVLLVASPKTGVKNLEEFIALVKRNPGKFSYGSSGVGSTLHFAGELIKQRAGVFITHIPYRSSAALTSDLIGGMLDFALISPTAAAPFLQSNRLVPLGITTAKRFPSLPQVPALGEHSLLKGYELAGWFAVAGPKDLPSNITQDIHNALEAGLSDPAIRKRFQEISLLPAVGKEDLTRLIRDDMAKYAALVKFANIKE